MVNDQTIHHRFNRVELIGVQLDLFIQVPDLAVYSYPDKTRFADILKNGLMFAFAVLDQGGQDHKPAPLRLPQDGVHNLLRGLNINLPSTVMAVRYPNPGIEQAKVIINFGYGSDRGARIMAGSFL